jgi:ornithine carbamoyltransferase
VVKLQHIIYYIRNHAILINTFIEVTMKIDHVLSVADLSAMQIIALIKKAAKTKKTRFPQVLAGKVAVLLFEKPSLRTRVSFDVAVYQLGGHCLYLSPEEVGLDKREPVEDAAKVLGRYVDCIIARTFSHTSLNTLAQYSGVPVINALSDMEHPCQAFADILTIYEKKGKLKDLELAYIGDGNNVAHSLMLAAAFTGVNFRIASPAGYEVNREILQVAQKAAGDSGSRITLLKDPRQAAAGVDIIYTDVWTSMGQETESRQRRAAFAGYQVNPDLLALGKKDVIFMHPLPAHKGEEVSEGLLNHEASVVFDQAENRLHAQRTLLVEIFAGRG